MAAGRNPYLGVVQMIYLLFVAIAVVSTIAIIAYTAHFGVADPGAKTKLYKKPDNDVIPFSGTKLILIRHIIIIIIITI